MSVDIEDFPRFSDAKASIERLQKVTWPDVSEFSNAKDFLKKIDKIIFNEFKVLPNYIKTFKPSQFPLSIYRVREVNAFSNINLFSEHSYPPVHLTGFNRCNFPESPVFYCSDNPMTALMEVVRDRNFENQKYCISKWNLIDDQSDFVFQSFLQTDLHPDNNYNTLRNREIEQLNVPFENKLDKDRSDGMLAYLTYLHSAFINDKSYALSASIAHRCLYATHNHATDILMYPSIQTQFKGVNMAIAPNFVDNMMRLQRLYIVELENFDLDNGRFDIKISNSGHLDKNIVFWRRPEPNDNIFKETVEADFGHMLGENFEWNFKEIK
jgi:hypothetical protein